MNRCSRLERKSVPGWLWQSGRPWQKRRKREWLGEEGEEKSPRVKVCNHPDAPVGVCAKISLNYNQREQGRRKYDGKDRFFWKPSGQADSALSVPRSLNLFLRV